MSRRRWILIDMNGQQYWRTFPTYQAASEFRFANGGIFNICQE